MTEIKGNNRIDRNIPPPVVDTPVVQLPTLRKHTLPNGITMLVYDRCNEPVNYLSVVSRGGQAEAQSAAVAVLTSVMQREGSQLHSGEDIAATMDFNGSWLRGVSHSHHMQQSMYSLNTRFHKVLPVFADLLFHPAFPQSVMEVRREALAKNLEVSAEDVSYVAKCHADKMIMGHNHPLANVDTPQQVRNLSVGDLTGFHSRYCTPENSVIYLCGHITPQIEELVAETFGSQPLSGTGVQIQPAPFSPMAADTSITHHPGALQSAVIMNIPAIPRTHPHYIPLHITVRALGGYFGSRLMQSIREEKGLTYGIDASLVGYIDGAHIQISAETDNRHVYTLIDEVRNEMRRLATDPCRGDELTRLRRSLSSSLASVTDSPFSTIDYHITMLLSGIPCDYFRQRQQAIASITPDTIAEMASLYLNPDNLRIAVVGDSSKM